MNAPNNMGNSGNDMGMFSRRGGPGPMGGSGNRGNQQGGGFGANDNYGQNFPPINAGGMNR
jgi:hypothetical protein